MKIPDYTVVLWHKSPPETPNLLARILNKSKTDPYESTDYEGFRDIHWGFATADEAIQLAEDLLEFAALDEVTKLTIISIRDTSFGRKVYKDTMASMRKS